MRNALFASLLLLGLFVPASAGAQGSDPKAAVELARRAKEAFDQGQWRGALELFEAAEEKAHSPVLVLYAARSRRNLGELIAARQLYERVVNEPLGPNAPDPFRKAQKDAAADLEELIARIPVLVIDRSGVPEHWRVTVDGVAVQQAEVPVDPGPHVVRAGEGGATAFSHEVVVDEGARITVVIEAPAQSGASASPAPGLATSGPVAEEQEFGSTIGPGLIALGLGAAGVGVGVALRVMAFETVADVKERCTGNVCLSEDEAEVDRAETLQTVSTVLFAVGGAAMATGVVLMIVLPDDEDDAPSVALDLRPGFIGMRGSF